MVVILFVLVILIFFLLQLILSDYSLFTQDMLSPLESGFESLKTSSLFGSYFFLMAVLFVLFDMELILILPGVLSSSLVDSFWILLFSFMLVTLLLEWVLSGLKWIV
uniref:NADH-ubiquinone oxidoreductase chain 3 n=1 Tax=Xiphinema americanum TaxID=208518 RepID=Q6TY93_XIPAM|nr:NADH dehydrogenase subunit 3 [Xiphinema americanum]AAQ75779.1 NADH dehydrogenase subunit 3 [Xiphinema americanum]